MLFSKKNNISELPPSSKFTGYLYCDFDQHYRLDREFNDPSNNFTVLIKKYLSYTLVGKILKSKTELTKWISGLALSYTVNSCPANLQIFLALDRQISLDYKDLAKTSTCIKIQIKSQPSTRFIKTSSQTSSSNIFQELEDQYEESGQEESGQGQDESLTATIEDQSRESDRLTDWSTIAILTNLSRLDKSNVIIEDLQTDYHGHGWTLNGGGPSKTSIKLLKLELELDQLYLFLINSELGEIFKSDEKLTKWICNKKVIDGNWDSFFQALKETVRDDYTAFQQYQVLELEEELLERRTELSQELEQSGLRETVQPKEIYTFRKLLKKQRIEVELATEYYCHTFKMYWEFGLRGLELIVKEASTKIAELAISYEEYLNRKINQLEQELTLFKSQRDRLLTLYPYCPVCNERLKVPVNCNQCKQAICISCSSRLDKCPFCRFLYHKEGGKSPQSSYSSDYDHSEYDHSGYDSHYHSYHDGLDT